ncbi:MAG TPA: hypothetical protein PLO64_07570 [Methanothermobacter sp.]|nr:transposase, IS605 OrfB family, central region [Methanothermobacter sp. MT-2]HHW05135.1 hypothetical protein [Methanothermobacter sp.]HOK73353.1 hypothetical protein [Methanothermobacter sp.]HOL69770.1 hypothetical protein [Methanothermobacter sp.]HPQ05135.1 hypothetical protein [Methanothermobacter sp.]
MTRKGSKKREKAKRKVCQAFYEKLEKNQRNNFLHKLFHYHIDKYNVILLEKLDIRKKAKEQ